MNLEGAILLGFAHRSVGIFNIEHLIDAREDCHNLRKQWVSLAQGCLWHWVLLHAAGAKVGAAACT